MKILRPEKTLKDSFVIEPGQKMHLVIFSNQDTTTGLSFKLKNNAKISIQCIILNSGSFKFHFEQDENSELVFNGAFALRREQELNFGYTTIQLGRNSKSHFELVGTLDDKAKKISSETIDFKVGATNAEGYEAEKVTLLSNETQNVAKPIILCAEENMHGEHNFSSGHLDPETIDYLRARGVNPESVKRIISREQILRVAKLCKNEAIIQEIEEALK